MHQSHARPRTSKTILPLRAGDGVTAGAHRRLKDGRRAALLAGLSLAALLAAPAKADTTAPAPAADAAASQKIEQVTVTAEKRNSTIQKTAISITAISGAQLRAAGITDLISVIQQTPGTAVRSSGPGQNEIDFRGLTSSGGNSPTVGFYLDETPVTPPAGADNGKVVIDPDLYDLSRVEILRGPQGTLYGSGSMGGTVKLITAQPQLDRVSGSFETNGSGTQGGGANGGFNAAVNIPIIPDKVALRIVGTEQHDSGWIDRVVLKDFPLEQDFGAPGGPPAGVIRGNVLGAPVAAVHKDVNDENKKSIRAELLVQVTDAFTLTPSLFYQDINQGGADTFDSPPGKAPSRLAHYQPADIAEPFGETFRLASLVGKYDFDDFSITSATSQWARRQHQTEDLSEDFQWLVANPYYIPSPLTENDQSSQFSQEIRVASSGNSSVKWLVGGFYSYFRSNFQQTSFQDLWIPEFGTNDFYDANEPQSVKQSAIFGNASWQINDQFKISGGARFYSYKSAIDVVETGIAIGGALGDRANETATGVTPTLTLSYTPTEDLLFYSTIAKGFRPGGGNQPVPVSGGASCLPQLLSYGLSQAPTTYGPDSVWSYELGEKATLLGGRLTFNGDVYYEVWRHIQQQVPLACGFYYTTNLETAGVYGAEVEMNARLTSELSLNASGGYTHATYDHTSFDTGTIAGARIPDVPKFTGSLAAVYRRPAFGKFDFQGRISEDYVGPIDDVTYGINRLPGYNLANLRLGLVSSGWSGYFFIKNLGNTRAELSDTNSLGANLPTFNRIATNQPRTIGIDLSYHF
jgi:outer membrane receptor protein involved in Fe transport